MPLIEINENTKQYARVVCTVLGAAASDVFSGKRRRARGRTILFLGKQTVLPHMSNTRKGIFLQRRQILFVPNTSKIISEKWLLRNAF
jgi:hypothetical protein